MKSILISIKPKWVAKILNGEKTLEIRKTAPKCDLPIDVYIYCTKDKETLLTSQPHLKRFICATQCNYVDRKRAVANSFNGKVVAKFTLNKVEEIRPFFHWCEELSRLTCLTQNEALDYLDDKDKSVGNPKRQGIIHAWEISDLEIFDRPMELSDFGVKTAPQSWRYVEKEEGI